MGEIVAAMQATRGSSRDNRSGDSGQWYCLLDKSTWEQHEPAFTALARDVHDAWLEFRRSGTEAQRPARRE